jgi:putative oxidoreductase
MGLKEVVKAFHNDAEAHHIPEFMVWMIVLYTSFAEFIGGILLVTGLFSTIALAALGLDLILVVFAFTYLKPMWDMKHVFPRFILIVALLLLPDSHNNWSLDTLLFPMFNK